MRKDELIPYKCSVCKEIVGYAPESIVDFMKKNNYLDTYKCGRCKEDKI